jgi:hypothetical protein
LEVREVCREALEVLEMRKTAAFPAQAEQERRPVLRAAAMPVAGDFPAVPAGVAAGDLEAEAVDLEAEAVDLAAVAVPAGAEAGRAAVAVRGEGRRARRE